MADAARDTHTSSSHVDVGDKHSKERQEQDDDVSGSAFGKDEYCVQPDDTDGHGSKV